MCYELSFGTSLAKVSCDGCSFLYVKKSEHFNYFLYILLITMANNTKC